MALEKPEAPRKQPKQQRSKILVESILQAGVEILEEPGQELTIEKLCERAGIGVGSLYQYYPSKEAVLNDIFSHVVEDEWGNLERSLSEACEMEFEAGIKHHARVGLNFIRKIYQLEPDFYRKYGGSYMPHAPQESELVSEDEGVQEMEKQFLKLFRKHPKADNMTDEQLMQLVFVYGQGSVAIVRSIVEERPEYLYDDSFMERLTNLFCLDAMFV